MYESKLLLNDMPVYHGNLFKIRSDRVISVVTNGKIHSASVSVLSRRASVLSEN